MKASTREFDTRGDPWLEDGAFTRFAGCWLPQASHEHHKVSKGLAYASSPGRVFGREIAKSVARMREGVGKVQLLEA